MSEKEENYSYSEEVSALMGVGTEFEGRLVFEGVVRIDGNFKGEIFSRDTLILGPESKVEAFVEADTVIVAGELEGEVRASNRVEIKKSGSMKGAVISPIFKIEEGAYFDGSTKMYPDEEISGV